MIDWFRKDLWYQWLPNIIEVVMIKEWNDQRGVEKKDNNNYRLDSNSYNRILLNMNTRLPWWCSGWESACQCRGHRFEPWSVKIPHAAEQLGPWATTTEPVHLEPVPRNERGRDSERPVHHDEGWPPLTATRESPRTETKTQHSQK